MKAKRDALHETFDRAFDELVSAVVNLLTMPFEVFFYHAYNAGLRDGRAGVRPPRCDGRPKLYLVKS